MRGRQKLKASVWKVTHMNPNDVGEQLHDRGTRGVALSAEEQTRLNEWYAQRDRAEAAVLSQPTPAQPIAALHAQVDRVMVQLGDVTLRIQTLSAENDAVRKEIAELQQRLAAKSAAQPALRSPTSSENGFASEPICLASIAAPVESAPACCLPRGAAASDAV